VYPSCRRNRALPVNCRVVVVSSVGPRLGERGRPPPRKQGHQPLVKSREDTRMQHDAKILLDWDGSQEVMWGWCLSNRSRKVPPPFCREEAPCFCLWPPFPRPFLSLVRGNGYPGRIARTRWSSSSSPFASPPRINSLGQYEGGLHTDPAVTWDRICEGSTQF
jgi:hypothetical protein